ncbi:MAG: TolB family protein, partial [Planctomycetia bacterium]
AVALALTLAEVLRRPRARASRAAGLALVAACALLLPACSTSSEAPPPDALLFLADGRQAGVVELYACDANGQGLRVVSGALVPAADVLDFAWSPDRQLVAFRADRDSDEQYELYLVDIVNGGSPVKVSGPLAAGGDVYGGYAWRDDGLRLAYVADANAPLQTELFVAALSGAAQRVSPTLAAGGYVNDFAWQPGGLRLAFRADVDGSGRELLHTVSAEGTGLSADTAVLGTTQDLAWSPSGLRVAVLADVANDGRFALRTLDALGGDAQDASALASAANPLASVQAFAWRDDGLRLAYLADRDVAGRTDAWAAAPGGSAQALLRAAPAGRHVLEVACQPAGTRVALRVEDATTALPTLWLVDDDGTDSVAVMGAPGTEGVLDLAWSPDGTQLAFRADTDVDGAPDLYSVLADGLSAPQRLSTLGTGEQVFDVRWSPDGTRLLYTSDDDAPVTLVRDLFLVTPGSPAQRLTSHTTLASSVGGYTVTQDGTQAAWDDGLTPGEPRAVFLLTLANVPLLPLQVTAPLDPPLTASGSVAAR